ncbi:family 43 glycosylhydrolase [Phytomonospora sp. NPDC050363]|uniref:glycoside hydrolase family 43 protein n=1 Tax=Phytomonospora sp. NPDC050363 TaxID=3155642 RepID=UPI0033DB76EF
MIPTARTPAWAADNGDGTYRNPVLHADWSDPDVVRAGRDFYLVASSFHRAPGLPLLHSRDLVNWSILGHALPSLEPDDVFGTPQPGCGVWAPALRHHDDRFWIFYPDPDRGIFVTTARDPAGEWSRPSLLKGGRGLIDPCPLWDEDGSAYLVHAWAKSRAGFNNRLTCHRMSSDATELLDEGRTVIDGDSLPGYRTLEGPKFYRRDGWYYIFAPAGGVADGWQSVFRSREVFGPYEERVVLAQGDTPVNGPHQGAWVTTAEGQDWFLHFQDKGPFGRVVHLQPLRWQPDGWPVIGASGAPVPSHAKPAVASPSAPGAPADGDDFAGTGVGPQWSWAANPRPGWLSVRPGEGPELKCAASDVDGDLRRLPNLLGQRLPSDRFRAATTMRLTGADTIGARAGLAVVGRTYAWIGLVSTVDGVHLVHRTAMAGEAEREAAPPVLVPVDADGTSVTVAVGVDVDPDGRCGFFAAIDGAAPRPFGEPFTSTAGHWVGATLGVFATAPTGRETAATARMSAFEVTGRSPQRTDATRGTDRG